MKTQMKIIVLASASLLVAGCVTNTRHIESDFGQAHDQTMTAQIVTPEIASGAPIMHPKKVNDAVNRYLDDDIKEPKEVDQIVTEVD